jgi:hypothetical protein
MEGGGGVEVQRHYSRPWRWMEVSGQIQVLANLSIGIHHKGDWVGP